MNATDVPYLALDGTIKYADLSGDGWDLTAEFASAGMMIKVSAGCLESVVVHVVKPHVIVARGRLYLTRREVVWEITRRRLDEWLVWEPDRRIGCPRSTAGGDDAKLIGLFHAWGRAKKWDRSEKEIYTESGVSRSSYYRLKSEPGSRVQKAHRRYVARLTLEDPRDS